MTYLASRSGIYYLRLHVPKPVQAALGQKEIFQSLQTSNHAEAKVLALSLSAQLLLSFARVKGAMKKAKTPEEEAQLARWISAAITPTSTAVAPTDEPLPAFTPEQELALTQEQSAHRTTKYEIDLMPNGLPFIKKADPGADHAAAKEALAAALEASKQSAAAQVPLQATKALTEEIKEALNGIKSQNINTAAKEYEHWLKNDRKVVSWDHYMASVNHFAKWIEQQSHNLPVHKITRQHIKDYKLVLQAIRSHKKPFKPLHPNNIYKRLGFIENFFRYCQQESWIEDGPKYLPTFGLKGEKPDYEDSEDSYEPFAREDLEAIFSAKNYQHIEDLPHRFWPPLIALFTGLRRTELAKLKPEQFSNFNPEKVWTLTVKGKVKNKNSRRTIPLHQTLIELGLLDYLEDVKKHFPKASSLFPYSANPGKAVGDGFATYLNTIGIDHPKKVLHSFRKNVASRLQQAGIVDSKYREHYTGHLKYSLHESIYSGKEKPMAFYTDLINNNLTYDLDLSAFKYRKGRFDRTLSGRKSSRKPKPKNSK